MAESQSMTTPEVVAKTLIDEHADFLREAVAMVAAQIMEAEITGEIGAGKGEVSAARATHRNGYRSRLWDQGRRGRACDPQKALGRGLLPELPGAAQKIRAGDRLGCDGGLRQRRLHP
jgi:hypothetical protein